VDVFNLHEQHLKAIDKKLDDILDKLSTLRSITKAHFDKMTDFMEQKFSTAVMISERLTHTAYNNRLSPGALHHDILLEIVRYVSKIANNFEMLSFVCDPTGLCLIETSYICQPEDNTFFLVLHILLVSPHNLMPLYEFILLVIHFNFSHNVSITLEIRINKHIA